MRCVPLSTIDKVLTASANVSPNLKVPFSGPFDRSPDSKDLYRNTDLQKVPSDLIVLSERSPQI